MSFADYKDAIKAVASAHGYDAALLASQAAAESAFNPEAVSPAGAQGLMQFMPSTWEWVKGKGWVPADASPFDPQWALVAGVRYMQFLLAYFPGAASPQELALASYNWGQGHVLALVKRTGRTDWDYLQDFAPVETRAYVARIMGRVADYRKVLGIAIPAVGLLIVGAFGLFALRSIL